MFLDPPVITGRHQSLATALDEIYVPNDDSLIGERAMAVFWERTDKALADAEREPLGLATLIRDLDL